MMDAERVVGIASELSSEVRVRVLLYLERNGPTRVHELAVALGISDSHLSNHLGRLRRAGLVTVDKSGRSVAYSLSSPEVLDILTAVERFSGVRRHELPRSAPDGSREKRQLSIARSCYDHLGGLIGVNIFQMLESSGAIFVHGDGGSPEVGLSGSAEEVFVNLGVGIPEVNVSRRKVATACADWKQGEYHLGGLLGAGILFALVEQEYLERVAGTRALRLTSQGEDFLRALGVCVDFPAAEVSLHDDS